MTEDLVMVVVANKLDLAQIRREVPYDDAQQFITRALGPDTLLYEVSAKEDNGTIEEIFVHIGRILVDRKQYIPVRKPITYLPMDEEPQPPKSSCCGF